MYVMSIENIKKLMFKLYGKNIKNLFIYPYTDSDGNIIYAKIKFFTMEDKKKIILMSLNKKGEYILKKPSCDLLYRYHRLVNNPEGIVNILEGEGRVDKLESMGFLATTCGGFCNLKKVSWDILKKMKKIVIWGDNPDSYDKFINPLINIIKIHINNKANIVTMTSCCNSPFLGLTDDGIFWTMEEGIKDSITSDYIQQLIDGMSNYE